MRNVNDNVDYMFESDLAFLKCHPLWLGDKEKIFRSEALKQPFERIEIGWGRRKFGYKVG